MALRQILCFCVAWRRNFVGKTMSVMKLDPEFFDREDVAAISGEFGAIGELV